MTARPWITVGTDLFDVFEEQVAGIQGGLHITVLCNVLSVKAAAQLRQGLDTGRFASVRVLVDRGTFQRRTVNATDGQVENVADVESHLGKARLRGTCTHVKAIIWAGSASGCLVTSANLNHNNRPECHQRADGIAPALSAMADALFAELPAGVLIDSKVAYRGIQTGIAGAGRVAGLRVWPEGVQVPEPGWHLGNKIGMSDFLPLLARVGTPARIWCSTWSLQAEHVAQLETLAGQGVDVRLWVPARFARRGSNAKLLGAVARIQHLITWSPTHAKILLIEGPDGAYLATGCANLGKLTALDLMNLQHGGQDLATHGAGMLLGLPVEATPDLPEPARAPIRAPKVPAVKVALKADKAPATSCRIPPSWVVPCAPERRKRRAKFRLNPLQLKIHRTVVKDGCRFTAIVGGWGGGKTGELLFLAKHFALTRPGRTVLVITDTAERYIKVLVPEAEKWLRPSGFVHRVRERRWVHHGTGSSIAFVPYYRPSTRSSSHNPLEGINADANVCLMDEAQTLSPEAAIKATGRLRAKGYPPQMVIFGLPVWGAWWAEMAEREGGVVIRGSSMANRANLEEGFFEQARERLTDAEYRAMVLGEPQAPEGLVYACWRPTAWPDGNLMPDKAWRYDERMEGRITIDPGVEKPHALILVHDHAQDIDVIVAEVGGERMAEHEFVQRILAVAWPREHAAQMPQDGRRRVLLDSGTIDRAARRSATSMHAPLDVKLRSTMDLLINPPGPGPDAGIGMVLWSPEGIRNIVVNGVACVVKWMCHLNRRRLLCLQSVWEAKPSGGAKGIRKAIETYKYHHGQPVKHGDEDPLDALRYLGVRHEWIAPVGSVERHLDDSPTRAAGMVRSMDGWAARGAGGFSRGR